MLTFSSGFLEKITEAFTNTFQVKNLTHATDGSDCRRYVKILDPGLLNAFMTQVPF